jgi:hypothetical protein
MRANEPLPDGNAKRPASNGSAGNEQSGRAANGRFAPGNPGGPGNPFARKVAELRRAMVNSITDEDVKEIARVLKEKAKEGNAAAIKLLFQYALGKQGAATDPDRVHLDDWQLLREESRMPAEMAGIVDGLPVELATKMTRTAWSCMVETRLGRPASGARAAAAERSASPAGIVPADIVDRLALGGLGAEMVSVLGGRAPSTNDGNGARERRRKEKRR